MCRSILICLIFLISVSNVFPASYGRILPWHGNGVWMKGEIHLHTDSSDGGSDGDYSHVLMAQKAVLYGCDFIALSDHIGYNISTVANYTKFLTARSVSPDLLVFFGIEVNNSIDHSCVFVTKSDDERDIINTFETSYSNPANITAAVNAIQWLATQERNGVKPVISINHPTDDGDVYSLSTLRTFDDASNIMIGWAAVPINFCITPQHIGGWEPYVYNIGDRWDQLLNEGRDFYIRTESDFHWEGGEPNRQPGNWNENYVYCSTKSYEAVLQGFQAGPLWAQTGDVLITSGSACDFTLVVDTVSVMMGEVIRINSGDNVTANITIKPNTGVTMEYVDLIANTTGSPALAKRFTSSDWIVSGGNLVMSYNLSNVTIDSYARCRGKTADTPVKLSSPTINEGWFYSNPIRIDVPPYIDFGQIEISGYVKNSSSNAISGVTVTLSGGSNNSAITGSNGSFSFSGLISGNYTVTPSKTGYVFSPSNKSYASLSSNQSNQLFFSTGTGTSTSASSSVVCGFESITDIAASNAGSTVSLETLNVSYISQGNTSLKVVHNSGSWPGVEIEAAALSTTTWSEYSNLHLDVFNPGVAAITFNMLIDNTAHQRYEEEGIILNPGKNTVIIDLAAIRTTTMTVNMNISALVFYVLGSDVTLPYTLYYDNMVLVSSSTEEEIPPVATYSVSGYMKDSSSNAISGVTVTLSGGASNSAITGIDGSYSFTGLSAGNYTITPVKTDWAFKPVSMGFTLDSNLINQNSFGTYTGTTPLYSISGYLKDGSSVAISAVTVNLTGKGTTTASTGIDGSYTFANLSTGTYTLTPTKTNYTFSPLNIIIILTTNTIDNNFVGTVASQPQPNPEPTINSSVKLENNKINPKNNEKVTVAFRIETTGKVKVNVFDLRGTLIATIVDEERNAGVYQSDTWDGKNKDGKSLPSGIYLIHIEAPGVSQTKKVCIIK